MKLNIFVILLIGLSIATASDAAEKAPQPQVIPSVIGEFMRLVDAQDYPAAYDKLSYPLQDQINLVEFMEVFYHLDEHYGRHKQQYGARLIEEKESSEQLFELSSARNTMIVYAFGVKTTNPDRISSFRFFIPEDRWMKVYSEL